jgi:2-dehydro-3-deoxyphosphogluconate aldolase/(4S)-4-hydroxy-2-oxoglutarate aldolase
MHRDEQIQRIESSGVIAIVRFDHPEELTKVAGAIKAGGVDLIEFTMTTPGAIDVINELHRAFGDDMLLGAGTVLDAETARAAMLAGAEFIVSPVLDAEVIAMCRRYSKVVIPGALTPTEILTAWEMGADLVKVFPASFGGPPYIRSVLAPLPQVKLVPVGGVSLENAVDFFRAGASAIAVGSSLVKTRAIAEGCFEELTETAKHFVAAVIEGRS